MNEEKDNDKSTLEDKENDKPNSQSKAIEENEQDTINNSGDEANKTSNRSGEDIKEEPVFKKNKDDSQGNSDNLPKGTKSKGNQSITNTNESVVEKQFNLVNGNVFLGNSKEDPTIPFSLPPNVDDFYDAIKLNDIIDKLSQNKVIVLQSLEFGALEAVSYSIAKSNAFEKLEKRLLRFNEKNVNRLELTIDWFIHNKVGRGKEQIIFIQLDSRSSIFNNSLFDEGSIYSDSIIEALFNKKIHLILWINSLELFAESNRNKRQLKYPIIDIPFFPFISRKCFALEDIELWRNKVLEQRRAGLWGNPEDEKEFYDDFKSVVSKGKQVLFDNILKRAELIGKRKEEIAKYAQEQKVRVTPSDIVNGKEPLSLYLTFIATYFENLTVREFNNLVDIILTNPNTVKKYKQQYEQLYKQRYKQPLKDRWNLAPDHFLSESRLVTFYSDELDFEVIDFEETYLREDFKAFFKKHFAKFLLEQFDFLFFERNLLLGDHISIQVFDGFSKFVALIANNDPSFYYEQVLLRSILSIYRQQIEIRNIDNTISIDRLIELVGELEEANAEKEKVYSKIARLIKEMLKYPKLQEYTEVFWNYLISQSKYIPALKLSKYLKHSSDFNKLYWLNQIINRGDLDAKKNAYIELLEYVLIKESPLKIYDFLDIIKKWFEIPNDKGLSAAGEYAIIYLFDYVLFPFGFKNFHILYGRGEEQYSLFMSEEIDDYNRVLFLIDWLFHPLLKDIYLKKGLSKDKHIYALYARIFEEWNLILNGLENRGGNRNKLLVEILEYTTKKLSRREFNAIEKELGKAYLQNRKELVGLKKENKTEKLSYYFQRNKQLKSLIQEIKSIRK